MATAAGTPQTSDFGFSNQFLRAHPDVAAVVRKAVAKEWDQTNFIAALHQTRWWRKRSDSQRRWDALTTENPAEARRQQAIAQSTVSQAARAMGVGLTLPQRNQIALSVARNGLTETEMRNTLAARWTQAAPGRAQQAGIGATTVDDLRKLSQAYGVRLGRANLTNYTRRILAGQGTVEGYTDMLRETAKRQYSSIAPQLDQGHTVAEILDPYLQIAQQELGINPANADITQGVWNAPLRGGGGGDPQKAMTFDEWTTKIRSDNQYGWDKTVKAKQAASGFALGLMQMFGNA